MREPQRLRKQGTHPPHASRAEPDLEIQVQDVMLMEVMDTLTDLLGEQNHIQFSQVVLLFCDPTKSSPPSTLPGQKERQTLTGARLSEDWSTHHQVRRGHHSHLGFYGGQAGELCSGLFPAQSVADKTGYRPNGRLGLVCNTDHPGSLWHSLSILQTKVTNSLAYRVQLAPTWQESSGQLCDRDETKSFLGIHSL